MISFFINKHQYLTLIETSTSTNSKTNQNIYDDKLKIMVRNENGRFGWSFKIYCMTDLKRLHNNCRTN